MQNQEQASLASNSYRHSQQNHSQLIQRIDRESRIKNISFAIIIFIIIANYIQVGSLRNNHQQQQKLLAEMVKNIQSNKLDLEKQKKQRISANIEIANNLTKEVQNINKNLAQRLQSIQSQQTRQKQKLSKFQLNLNKLKNGLNKPNQQSQSLVSNDQSKTKTYSSSQLKRQNIYLSFLLDQTKQRYHQQKIKWLQSLLDKPFLSQQKVKQSFLTSLDNLKLSHSNIISQNYNKQIDEKIHERLSKQYNFQKYEQQLPFCIVVPTYNNAKNYRYQYNLQSIMNLNYKNYKVVIIDDVSTDGTYELLLDLISLKYPTKPISLIQNQIHMTALPNINKGIRQYCQQDDIVLLVDGDDQLLVKDSLKVFNAVYQQKKAHVVYSNHIKLYWHQNQVYQGWSKAYTQQEKTNNRYREVPQKISHLRSFKASLYLRIKQEDLKDQHGSWFQSTYDEAICLPILQMSCGRIEYVKQYFYLYNFGIGTNDLMVDGKKQKQIADYVKFNKQNYKCLQSK